MTRACRGTLLIILGLILALTGGITGQAAWHWLVIYIPAEDMRIDLGVIDSSCYDITTDSWCAISDGKRHRIWVYTSNPRGLSLTVAARDTGSTPIDDLADLQIRGGDLADWTGLSCEVTLKTLHSAGSTWVNDIEYRYRLDAHDSPGSYEVTLTYTATVP